MRIPSPSRSINPDSNRAALAGRTGLVEGSSSLSVTAAVARIDAALAEHPSDWWCESEDGVLDGNRRPCHPRTRVSEGAREGVAVNIIQRQLGHTDLGTTSTYLQGTDPSEIIDAVRSRRQPTISATAGLTL